MKFSILWLIAVVFFNLWAVGRPLIIHADERKLELKLKAPAVAYQPNGMTPDTLEPGLNEFQIRADLRKLRNIGFRGIVTYGANGIMGKIPEFARSEGFDGTVIMGIWDITSKEELENAIAQARFVDGYCLGNEGLGVRYNAQVLISKMKHLRAATNIAVATSEPIFQYFQPKYQHVLCSASDWIFPIMHPFWNNPFGPEQAVQWIMVHYDYLSAVSGRSIIIKEAGFPSDGHEKLSEADQIIFFKALAKAGLHFFHFEAFDQPWKADVENNPLIEAHWGLFKADGTPKKVVPFLTQHYTE